MKEEGGRLSRNPNLCACCSSILDGMDDETVNESERPAPEPSAPKAGIIPAKPSDLEAAA